MDGSLRVLKSVEPKIQQRPPQELQFGSLRCEHQFKFSALSLYTIDVKIASFKILLESQNCVRNTDRC